MSDFIESDFNMSALSTVGDVFSDPEFSAPGNSFLWGLGALEEQYRERTGFLIMPKRPCEWRVDSHGCCYKFDNAALGFRPCDQSAHLPVFLHLRTTNLPGPPASHAASMHNKEEWNAGITNMTVREGDVHDCDPVRQGHVSAFPFTPSAVARESFASQLCLLTVLTLGRFAASLCLCLCLCQLGAGGAGQSPRSDSQALCLTSSGRVLVFLCVPLVSQQHISHLFAWAMAAAGVGLRKSGKSRAKSSTQGWSPNSDQAANDQSASFVDVLVSEQGQQSSSSGLTLPQQQNQQAGTQTQSASSLDRPQNGVVQYRPTGNNPGAAYYGCLGSVPASREQ